MTQEITSHVPHRTFNTNEFNFLEQPFFLGEKPNVQRYDQQKHIVFEDLTNRQLSFFWRPEEIDLSKDRLDFQKLTDGQKFIFTQNLYYQILMDSVQGRAPVEAFSPLCSDTALENWILTWTFSESIHSRSYTHIIRNIFPNPSEEFDQIMNNTAILARAESIGHWYDILMHSIDLYRENPSEENKRKFATAMYLTFHSVNALEAIRFYVSFACSWSFPEFTGLMEGNAKIIKLIARDEALHLKGTQYILNAWHRGTDDLLKDYLDEDLVKEAEQLFLDCVKQEHDWVDHLFSQGGTLPGLTPEILKDYVEYVADQRMRAVGLRSPFEGKHKENPLPWIRKWLNSASVQTAAQESELSDYLIGQVKTGMSEQFLKDLKAEFYGK